MTDNSGGRVYVQAFRMTVPVVETCSASISAAPATTDSSNTQPDAQKQIPLSIFQPVAGRLPTLETAGRENTGEFDVVYGGRGTLEEMKGKPIPGRIVALELKGGEGAAGWQRAAELGAAGIVFLGRPELQTPDFLDKQLDLPLGIPRFYCDDQDAVGFFRQSAAPPAGADETPPRISINLRMRWQEKTVRNVICIIPAKGMAGRKSAGETGGDNWMILQARYDGASPVMGRSPGATFAANAGVLMDFAQQIAQAPVHAGVICVWTGGDEWNNRGTREFLDLLDRKARDTDHAAADLASRSRQAQVDVASAADLLGAANRILDGQSAAGTPGASAAQAAISQELLREVSDAQDHLAEAPTTAGKAGDGQTWQARKDDLLSAMSLMTGGSSAAPPLSPSARALFSAACGQAIDLWTAEHDRRQAFADAIGNWPEIRRAIPSANPMLFLSLSLTAGSPRSLACSLFSKSFYSRDLDSSGPMAGFARAFRRYADQNIAGTPVASAFSGDDLSGTGALESRFPVKIGFSSDAALVRGIPALAAATMLDAESFLDTPNDTEENLHWPELLRQEQALIALLIGTPAHPGALADPTFYARARLSDQTDSQFLTLYQQDSGETLPRITAPEALVGGENQHAGNALGPALAGTRRFDWYLTHADGTVQFDSVSRAGDSELRLSAFAFDDAGRTVRALAQNQSDSAGMISSFYPDSGRPLRAMLFRCRPFDAYGLFDPRYLDTLEQVQILDGRRRDDAAFSAAFAHSGAAALFLPAGADQEPLPWQLLLSRGDVGNRMILINASPQHPEGDGFPSADPAQIGPLPWRSARDFLTLDSRRNADLQKFGISSEIISGLQSASEKQLAAGESAERKLDYPAQLAAADALWSLQSDEYQALIATSNGIIHGVIFLLLGVVPFSFFLERLLIGASNVYRQIGWFAGFFALMTAGLWFHPAFRISPAPLMILLAFLILALSSAVVFILWGKFQEEIASLRSGSSGAAAHVTSLRRAAVLGAAIRLGLSNMRRRGMRTGLTLATLVLLTFTLLCFTSVRETVEITPYPVAFWKTAAAAGLPAPPGRHRPAAARLAGVADPDAAACQGNGASGRKYGRRKFAAGSFCRSGCRPLVVCVRAA